MVTLSPFSMQAQWAEAVTHENEKLHQLIEMQKAIITDLQGGNSVASPMASQAQDLSKMALAAKGMSQEACELRKKLLSRTGHAKVLQSSRHSIQHAFPLVIYHRVAAYLPNEMPFSVILLHP